MELPVEALPPLTDRERDLYNLFLKNAVHVLLCPPLLGVVGEFGTGYVTAYGHLTSIVRKGYLRMHGRAIVVPDRP